MNLLMLADSVWFMYICIPIAFIGLCWVVEGTDNASTATILLAIVLAALQLFTDIHPFSYIINDPLRAVVIAALYIAIGVGYLWLKWISFTGKASRDVAKLLNPTKSKYTSDEMESAARRCGYKSCPLQVSDYKGKIIGWMAYWPVSAAWTIFNDPIRRLYDAIYNSIAKSLQAISNKQFNNIINK